MIITPIKTRIFTTRENLTDFILSSIPKIQEKTVFVITSKIVALAQRRVVFAGEDKKDEIIRSQSKNIGKTPWCVLAYRDGEWSANAGIDASNIKNGFILLPTRPMYVARELWSALRKKYAVRSLGVIITDTRSVPLKKGTLGAVVGYAGFDGIKSYIGKKDLFARKLRMTQVNAADSLAAAAVLAMGEGNECMPLATISGAPISFWKKIQRPASLRIDPRKDIYKVVYRP